MSKGKKIFVVAGLLGLLVVAIIAVVAFSPKNTPQEDNQTDQPAATEPAPISQDEKPIQVATTSAEKFKTYVEEKKPSFLMGSDGKPNYFIFSEDNIDGDYIQLVVQNSKGEQYLSIVDFNKTGAQAVIFGPKKPLEITDADLQQLPQNVYSTISNQYLRDY